jgi:hypothetical protein
MTVSTVINTVEDVIPGVLIHMRKQVRLFPENE